MGKLIIMSGAPGSGKSTYAKKLVQNESNYISVSRDKIRFSLLSPIDHYFSKENEVLKNYYKTISSFLNMGYNVIADSSNLSWKARKTLITEISKHSSLDKVDVIYMRPSLETCFQRNDTREGRENVPHGAITNMWNSQTDPANDPYHYNNIIYVGDEE